MKRVGNVAYKLELPETLKVHPMIYVSLLKPYRAYAPLLAKYNLHQHKSLKFKMTKCRLKLNEF